MNWFQKWLVDAVFQIFKQLKHIERKIDFLSQHLGATLPSQLIQAGEDLSKKSQALQAALDAQAQQPTTQKET